MLGGEFGQSQRVDFQVRHRKQRLQLATTSIAVFSPPITPPPSPTILRSQPATTMGLVSYSESESSDSEAEEQPPKPTAQPTATTAAGAAPSKKPFQKVVDRSNPGKILVSLPQAAPADLIPGSSASGAGEPPAKRARTAAGGGRFSGFNSFLPAPKNANKTAQQKAAAAASGLARPGVSLTTSAAPGFSRDGGSDDVQAGGYGASGGMSLPPPKKHAEPSIPEGLKPEEEVKLVGKPMMFKPLSVARNGNKKKTPRLGAAKAPTIASPGTKSSSQVNGTQNEAAPPPPPKKVSLFSLHTEEPDDPAGLPSKGGAYEPLFTTEANGVTAPYDEYADYAAYAQPSPAAPPGAAAPPGRDSLDTIADDLNLSAAARRELFGRDGGIGVGSQGAQRVVNFNLDREYAHNEEVRAAGDQRLHNPVRAIQGGRKHSLRQLVQNVQGQRAALEETWAAGKNNRKEASSRYGW